MPIIGLEEVLRRYLDPELLDPPEGYISSENVKDVFRSFYQDVLEAVDHRFGSNSAYGPYVRTIDTSAELASLALEAQSGGLPNGVIALINRTAGTPGDEVRVWDGTNWLNIRGTAGVPPDLSTLYVGPTQPVTTASRVFWLDTSDPSPPFPLMVRETPSSPWLEVTAKGDPGETLHPDGFVASGDLLPDPPVWTSGPLIGNTKPLAVYTSVVDKRMWVYDPRNPIASSGPATPEVTDPNTGAVITPAVAPAGWIDMGSIEGPPGPRGPVGPPGNPISVYDPAYGYLKGDVVSHPGPPVTLYSALVDNAGACPGPDWQKIGEDLPPFTIPEWDPAETYPIAGMPVVHPDSAGRWVLYVNTAPVPAGTASPPNAPWREVSVETASSAISKWVSTASYAVGDTVVLPGANPLDPYMMYRAEVDIPAGLGVVPGAHAAWKQIGTVQEFPKIQVSNVAGQTPITHPPTAPNAGDYYINTTDDVAWVYTGAAAGGIGGAVAATWLPLVTAHAAPATVTVINVAGQTPFLTPPGASEIGDIFIDVPDKTAWVFDGTDWYQIESPTVPPTITVLTTAGEDPTTNPPATPNAGDVVINTADSLAWIYDGTNWLSLASATQVTTSSVAGETPAVPGTAVIPTPRAGDTFHNETDETTWLYDGTRWVVVSEPPDKARGTVTYLTDISPVAPFDAANNWGFGVGNVEPDPTVVEPEPGDVWINHALAELGVFQ